MVVSIAEYIALRKDVESRNLLVPVGSFWVLSMSVYILLASAGFFAVIYFNNWAVAIAGSVLLSFVFMQFAYLGHDAGHSSLSRRRAVNEIIGYFCHSLLLGTSFSYWKYKHSRHHSSPNHENSDPDINNDPFSFSEKSAKTQKGISRVMTRYQAFLLPVAFIIMLPLMMRDSLKYMIKNKKNSIVDIILILGHFSFFFILMPGLIGWAMAIAVYSIICIILGLHFGFSFIPNHIGMPILEDDNSLSFVEKQVITARNMTNNWFMDFVLGGLNYQIEHHLFPTAPRSKLKHMKPIVREFCIKNDIPYNDESFKKTWTGVFAYLNNVGKQAQKIKIVDTVLDMV